MFYYNDSQLIFKLDYLLDRKELAFMITKTLIMRCYTIKCDLSLCSLQQNTMHYIIALTHKVTLKEQTNIIVQS